MREALLTSYHRLTLAMGPSRGAGDYGCTALKLFADTQIVVRLGSPRPQGCMGPGINTFDTANLYSNGDSERILGNFIKKVCTARPRDTYL